jgi:hypothetical protein
MTMTRTLHWLAICSVVLFTACAGGTGTPVPAGQGAPPAAAGLPDLGALPAVHRAAEVPDNYTFTATDLVAQQQGLMNGTELVVKKSKLSWAVVGANFGDRTASLLTLTGTLNNAYVMVSDYGTGRWKLLSGPRKTGGQLPLPAGIMRADGDTFFAFLCPDNGLADLSVSVSLTGGTPPTPDAWNVMVWIAADNDLAPDAVLNLNQMEQVGSTDQVRVFAGYDIDPAQAGGGVSGIDQVHFIKVVQDSNANAINVGGDPANESFPRAGYDSSNPARVRDFVDWVNTNFPAKHSALILWDHGDGWVVGNKNFSAATGARLSGKEAEARRFMQAVDRLQGAHHRKGLGAKGVSGCLYDETDGNSQSLTDNTAIASALSGCHFDVIAFDACNMGQLEALYDYRNLADVLAASEVLVPGDGQPYNSMLSAFGSAGTKDAPALGAALVQPFVQHYTNQEYVTFGSFDATKIDALTTALAAFAAEVKPKAAAESAGFQQALAQAFQPEFGDGARDLKGFLTAYKGITTDAAIKTKIDAVLSALSDTMLDFAQYDQPGTNGTAIYLPNATDDSYGSVNFNTATGWLDMLTALGIPGGGGGGGFTVHADWVTGDYIEIDWADPDADADLETLDPSGTFGAPWEGQDTANLHFSPDSYDSGLPVEWAQLRTGAKQGDYLIHLHWFDYYGMTPPPTLTVNVKLLDSGKNLKQDLGACVLALDGESDYATLTLAP